MATCSRFLNDQATVVARGNRQAIRPKGGIDMKDGLRTAIGSCLRVDIYFVGTVGNHLARCGIPNLRFRRSCSVRPMEQRDNLLTILGKLQSENPYLAIGSSLGRFDIKPTLLFAGLGFPDEQRALATGADKPLAIRGKRTGLKVLVTCMIPTCNRFSVWREDNRVG
jgi:hypothetical protein